MSYLKPKLYIKYIGFISGKFGIGTSKVYDEKVFDKHSKQSPIDNNNSATINKKYSKSDTKLKYKDNRFLSKPFQDILNDERKVINVN